MAGEIVAVPTDTIYGLAALVQVQGWLVYGVMVVWCMVWCKCGGGLVQVLWSSGAW